MRQQLARSCCVYTSFNSFLRLLCLTMLHAHTHTHHIHPQTDRHEINFDKCFLFSRKIIEIKLGDVLLLLLLFLYYKTTETWKKRKLSPPLSSLCRCCFVCFHFSIFFLLSHCARSSLSCISFSSCNTDPPSPLSLSLFLPRTHDKKQWKEKRKEA
jgi:hypothetical protein